MKPRLACDIDGVIFDVVGEYIAEINRCTGKDYKREDLHEYSFAKAWDLDENFVWDCINTVLSRKTHPIYNGVRLLICIAQIVYSPIFFFTARKPRFNEITKFQLQGLYNFPFMLYSWAKPKGRYCREGKIDYMIEDSPHHTENIIEVSPITTVFLMDRPYNQDVGKNSRIIRVRNMWEVWMYLLRKSNKGDLPRIPCDLSEENNGIASSQ